LVQDLPGTDGERVVRPGALFREGDQLLQLDTRAGYFLP
jgi:hypothetical protein